MIGNVAQLAGIALLLGFGLHKSDDSNLQITIVPLAVIALFLLLPEGSRSMGGLGIAAGTVGYVAIFLYNRMRAAPMPDYAVTGESFTASGSTSATPGAEKAPVSCTPRGPDGPYYMPNTPERIQVTASGTLGEPMRFVGQVLRSDGSPVAGACIEIWHADGNGDYDHHNFNMRGHQFTNENGEFLFETIKPSGYGTRSMSLIGTVDFRSAHIHVKINVDSKDVTTQVWFPDDPRNSKDVAFWKFKDTNVVSYVPDASVLIANFDFVI